MGTKKCKFCQSDIPEKATVCPVCKRRLNTGRLILAGILAFVGFCVILGAATSGGDETSDETRKGSPVTTEKIVKNSPKITMREFTEIEIGMTYEEVVALIGSEGELVSEAGIEGYVMKIYSWEGDNFASNATITFDNGKVSAKAQFGLDD